MLLSFLAAILTFGPLKPMKQYITQYAVKFDVQTKITGDLPPLHCNNILNKAVNNIFLANIL